MGSILANFARIENCLPTPPYSSALEEEYGSVGELKEDPLPLHDRQINLFVHLR